MSRFMRIAMLAVAMTAGVIATTGIAQPAQAGTSYTASGGAMYWCTDTSAFCRTTFGAFSKGDGLTMICWQDDRTANGVYPSNRWFYVRMDDGRVGFIHSSEVKRQTSTPNCSTKPEISASLWAIAHRGEVQYANRSQAFVRDTYRYGAHANVGNVSDYLQGKAGHLFGTDTTAPRGAIVYWGTPTDCPRRYVTAISLGNGYAVGPSQNSSSVTPNRISNPQANGKEFIGWVIP